MMFSSPKYLSVSLLERGNILLQNILNDGVAIWQISQKTKCSSATRTSIATTAINWCSFPPYQYFDQYCHHCSPTNISVEYSERERVMESQFDRFPTRAIAALGPSRGIKCRPINVNLSLQYLQYFCIYNFHIFVS